MITNCVQRWRERKPRFRPAGELINTKLFEVSALPEDRAKAFIEKHHYSGTYPAARRRFGLFQGSDLVGAAVFSHPCNDRTITNVFGCEKATDGLELGRFVLLDKVPANGESWFLARCRELLKVEGFVGVVSFSDDTPRTKANGDATFAGHIGTIYQASNAAFLGRGTARRLRLLPDGKVLSDRSIQKIRSSDRGLRYAAGILESYGAADLAGGDPRVWLDYHLPKLTRTVAHPGNLKYAWSFSKAVRLESLPYPKVKVGGQGRLFV
jgi:hypothetical protein